ncbi:MAG: hypothetical protein M1482_13340 [Chloroflexi bacterium]|nr:hypothetical protein [Chloroflexota bacterium]
MSTLRLVLAAAAIIGAGVAGLQPISVALSPAQAGLASLANRLSIEVSGAATTGAQLNAAGASASARSNTQTEVNAQSQGASAPADASAADQTNVSANASAPAAGLNQLVNTGKKLVNQTTSPVSSAIDPLLTDVTHAVNVTVNTQVSASSNTSADGTGAAQSNTQTKGSVSGGVTTNLLAPLSTLLK